MKKKIVGFALSLLPIYSFFSWLYIYSRNTSKSQEVRLDAFNKMFLGAPTNYIALAIINIILSVLSIYFLTKMVSSLKTVQRIIGRVLVFLLVLIIFYNIWSLL